MLVIPTISVSTKLQHRKLRKLQDFQAPRNSDSTTFKDQPCFQVVLRLWI